MAPITSVRRARSKNVAIWKSERLRCVYVLLIARNFLSLSSNGLFFSSFIFFYPNVLRDRDTFTSRNTHARLTLSNDNVRTRAFFWGFALLALLATLSAVFTSSSFDLASSAPGGEGDDVAVRRCRRMQTNERLGKNWRFNRVLCRRFVFIPRDRDSLRRLLRRIIAGGNIGGFGFVDDMPSIRLWRQGLPRQNLRVH